MWSFPFYSQWLFSFCLCLEVTHCSLISLPSKGHITWWYPYVHPSPFCIPFRCFSGIHRFFLVFRKWKIEKFQISFSYLLAKYLFCLSWIMFGCKILSCWIVFILRLASLLQPFLGQAFISSARSALPKDDVSGNLT